MPKTGKIRTIAACMAVVAIALYFLVPQVRTVAVDGYENVAYEVDPSAARAFAYGERHFDATDPAEYDINRAAYFFNLATAKDPTYPYLYHELARIDFLKGNFVSALAKIDFQISMHGDSEPNSYYVRGLIEGYMGDYADAVNDYAHYLQFDSYDWAALNDFSWVLLKDGRFQDAANITSQALRYYPDNPWLLNSNAIALYQLGDVIEVRERAEEAVKAASSLTQAQWLVAYPGNDPEIAAEGIVAFQKATLENMHTIDTGSASSTLQSSMKP